MTRTRWLWEGWQIRIADDVRAEAINKVGVEGLKALQQLLVNVLGLNIEPFAAPDPVPEDPNRMRYRFPEEGEFTPLAYYVARPDALKSAMEKIEAAGTAATVGVNPGEMPPPLLSDEDLEFFDSIPTKNPQQAIWDSPETQNALRQLVKSDGGPKLSETQPQAPQSRRQRLRISYDK